MKFKDKTRGGHEVRIYATDAGGDYPIHGAVFVNGSWCVNSWTAQGENLASAPADKYDLLPLREPSEAAVEAAKGALAPWRVGPETTKAALRAAYEIDFPEGGK